MFYCRLVQEHQDKAFQQLAGQMNQTLRMEAERFARGAAEVEDEYQMKTKEREAKNKAAIESIAEHRATVVKKIIINKSFLFLFLSYPSKYLLDTLWVLA